MSTYLVAFVISDFEYKTGHAIDHNNVTFRIWARKDALDQVKNKLTLFASIINLFKVYAGMPMMSDRKMSTAFWKTYSRS